MESLIFEVLKKLKILYIVHIIILVLILVFNFIALSQIIWLKKVLYKLYFYATITSPIHFILPIISLILIFMKKIAKKNLNIFKICSIILCAISLIFGFLFVGIIMMNALESPEFCKECPFNLPIEDINKLIQSDNLNKKCQERRCAVNNQILDEQQKNENNYYEYLCNYDPTSEFEEIKESNDSLNDNNNRTNDTLNRKNDKIICTQINKNDVIISLLENNYVFNFYDKCNIYADFYICERTQTPNKFDIEENFVCPEKSYITKLVVFCLFNIFLNLIFNFLPAKLEYNKYIAMINIFNPRIVNRKSNSFSSTLGESKIKKESENLETEDKFVRSPTELIIVYNNNDNLTNKKLNENNNVNNINNDNNDKNHKKDKEIIIKKSKSKKINLNPTIESNQEKNIKELKSSKNVRKTDNKLNLNKKLESENFKEIRKKSQFVKDENKVNLSFDDTVSVSTKRIILPGHNNKNCNSDD